MCRDLMCTHEALDANLVYKLLQRHWRFLKWSDLGAVHVATYACMTDSNVASDLVPQAVTCIHTFGECADVLM